MIKLQAAQRLIAAEDSEWWESLGEEQQKEYIEEHPDSKYADDYRSSEPKSKDTTPSKPTTKPAAKDQHKSLEEGPKAPPPLEETPKLEHPDYLEPRKPKKKKSDEETSLIRYLLHKGGEAGKKKAKELLRKGGHEALRRLIDPMALTDIGKKGELPALPFRFKSKEGKIKDLQSKLTKLRNQQKGFGKNVPQSLKDQIKELSEKLEKLQE